MPNNVTLTIFHICSSKSYMESVMSFVKGLHQASKALNLDTVFFEFKVHLKYLKLKKI